MRFLGKDALTSTCQGALGEIVRAQDSGQCGRVRHCHIVVATQGVPETVEYSCELASGSIQSGEASALHRCLLQKAGMV